MNKRLLTGLCAVVMLSGLVGCGPKEPKQENEQTTTEQTTEAPKQKRKKILQNLTSLLKRIMKNLSLTLQVQNTKENWLMRMVIVLWVMTVIQLDRMYNIWLWCICQVTTNYTVNAIVVDKNGHISDKYRLNKEVEERDITGMKSTRSLQMNLIMTMLLK